MSDPVVYSLISAASFLFGFAGGAIVRSYLARRESLFRSRFDKIS